jgi:hypothetical protein
MNKNSTTKDKDLDTGQNTDSSQVFKEKASNASSNVKRMSISLPSDIADLLEYLAKFQGISQNEALRKAIATEAYFLQERQQGNRVLIQAHDQQIKEVIFR